MWSFGGRIFVCVCGCVRAFAYTHDQPVHIYTLGYTSTRRIYIDIVCFYVRATIVEVCFVFPSFFFFHFVIDFCFATFGEHGDL